jgi:hypothetical protein
MEAMTMATILPRRREDTRGVTFGEFRALASVRGWTAEAVTALLAARGATGFGGPRSSPYYETPKAYLYRVLRRGHARDDAAVIPYGCLIQLYLEHVTPAPALLDAVRRCACGCGSAVFGRRRWAADACRKWLVRGVAAVGDPGLPKPPVGPPQNRGVIPDKRGDLDPTPCLRETATSRGLEARSLRWGSTT